MYQIKKIPVEESPYKQEEFVYMIHSKLHNQLIGKCYKTKIGADNALKKFLEEVTK